MDYLWTGLFHNMKAGRRWGPDSPQFRPHTHGRQGTGSHITILFNFGNNPTLAQEQIIVVGAGPYSYVIACLSGQSDYVILPVRRPICAEDDRAVRLLRSPAG